MAYLLQNRELIHELVSYGLTISTFIAAIGLLLNAYVMYRNILSRKLTNYLEIAKSHRDLWKLTINDPEKYERVLDPTSDIVSKPISYVEHRFTHMLLLHMTCSFYFTKFSDIVTISEIKQDVDDVLSLPIPRAVWMDTKHYFNKDFVRFVDKCKKISNRCSAHKKPYSYKKPWQILILTDAPNLVAPIFQNSEDFILFRGSDAPPITPSFIRHHNIDFILCFGYSHILKPNILSMVTTINVHPGILPNNRGPNPNLWAFINNIPSGVTIHYIDEGIDTGDIIAQKEIDLGPINQLTLQTAYDNLIAESLNFLFSEWPKIRNGKNSRSPQLIKGKTHTFADQEPFSDLFTEEGLNMPLDEFIALARERINK